MESPQQMRLMVVDPVRHTVHDAVPRQLSDWLQANDLLVVNDAATFPALVSMRHPLHGALEARFVDAPVEPHTRVVLFGAGDYRDRTEDRAAPPRVHVGDSLWLGDRRADVVEVSSLSPRLLTVAWHGSLDRVWDALYAQGHPVQYSYISERLPLWSVQTVFAARPWAAEMPSAARPLSWALLLDLRRKGVEVVSLTHAAGLSATGDPALDAALPLPERYEINDGLVQRIERARREGGRVIAVGTTVVRALEACVSQHGSLRAGVGVAELVIGPHTPLRVVDGLLTGIHVEGESHFRLLQAFVDLSTLVRASEHAHLHGYRQHEHGDACLVLPRRPDVTHYSVTGPGAPSRIHSATMRSSSGSSGTTGSPSA